MKDLKCYNNSLVIDFLGEITNRLREGEDLCARIIVEHKEFMEEVEADRNEDE